MSVIEVFLRRPEALEVPSVDWDEGAGLRTQGSRLPFEMLRHSKSAVHQPPVSSRYPALELGYSCLLIHRRPFNITTTHSNHPYISKHVHFSSCSIDPPIGNQANLRYIRQGHGRWRHWCWCFKNRRHAGRVCQPFDFH